MMLEVRKGRAETAVSLKSRRAGDRGGQETAVSLKTGRAESCGEQRNENPG